jgi:hypothetical protein
MVNAGIFNFMNVALDGHTLHVSGQDGYPRRNIKSIPPLPLPTDGTESVRARPGQPRERAGESRRAGNLPAAHGEIPDRQRPSSRSCPRTSSPRSW